jgi:UDP-GlcNAc:undecaprenyl-phosphate/decaprenyl-phosphate GlcNAc-1-phosphate transferase
VTTWIVLAAVSVVLVLALAWALPAWAAGRIVRAIEATGRKVTNFRGREVTLGLGLVWLVWPVAVVGVWNLIGLGTQIVVTSLPQTAQVPAWLAGISTTPFGTAVTAVPFLLMAGAFAFGMADDSLGGSGDRGFRGHFAALREGRLTTGMLKLAGIGGLAFVSATGIATQIKTIDPMVGDATGWAGGALIFLTWIVATLVIALAANLVNLTDLRPGRALKSYIPLALVGVGLSVWGAERVMEQRIITSAAAEAVNGAAAATPGLPGGASLWVWLAGAALCLLVLALGPVLAVWKYDLGERAMLGDAGANAMGAFAGFLMARSAPLWLLGVIALVLLVLNLASERVSFSSVIERTAVLRWLDGLGRLPGQPAGESMEEGNGSDEGTRAGGPAAEDEKPRRDDVS